MSTENENHLTTYIADAERKFLLPNDNINFQSLINCFPPAKTVKSPFHNLQQTIDQLDFDFYNDLLPKIAQWASDHEQQSKLVEPLRAGRTARITYTSSQVRYILANAFFLNTIPGYGNIDLTQLYLSMSDGLSIARIRCLIEYFRLSTEINDHREISIERYSYGDQLLKWNEQTELIKSSKVNVFTDRMENAKEAQGFVDFANRHIHIHRIIPSATQEEVLFSCCPEAFVSILLCETLNDDEIVILRGCKRFIEYTGYADSFAYQGHYPEQNPSHIQDILVLDACYSNQFASEILDRDLAKAFFGFQKSQNEIIVTGHWGCGVFGGDFFLKFLQQVCAATALGERFKRLEYSVYGDERLASDFKDLLQRLEEKKKTVAEVYQLMIDYSQTKGFPGHRPGFRDYLNKWLASS